MEITEILSYNISQIKCTDPQFGIISGFDVFTTC